MKIGVDIDGVLADQTRHILKMINTQTGNRFRKRDVTAWNAKLAGIDIEQEIERHLRQDRQYVRGMCLIRGAREALARLAKVHELVAITNRPEEMREVTDDWIQSKKLPIHRIEYKRGSSKSEVNVDVLVDDNPMNVHDFVCSNGIGILFLQPWNRAESGQVSPDKTAKVYRAANWDAVVGTIIRIHGQERRTEGV